MKIHSEKGVSAVEFALVLPILLMLTFGIIEFGILLFDKAVITNASREGARFGIVYATNDLGEYLPRSEADIEAVVMNYANDILINLGPGGQEALTDVDIEPSWETNVNGDLELTVTVNFTYDFLVFPNLTTLVGGSFDGTMPLKGETVMRME